MHMRRAFYALSASAMSVLITGCTGSGSKPASESVVSTAPTPLSQETVVRVYWKGKSRLGVEAGAFFPMRIWLLPENRKLEGQVLEQLSFQPLQRLRGNPALAGTFATLMLPMLHDVVQWESYFEVRQPTNRAGESVFAIRLAEAQARGWATNLVVAGSLLGSPVQRVSNDHDAWLLQLPAGASRVERIRVGDWTVVASTRNEKNDLLAEIVARIRQAGGPFVPEDSKCWLQSDFDPRWVSSELGLGGRLAEDLQHASATLTGDGANVIAHGTLDFARPLDLEIEPWDVPTNLIQQPLAGFTAIRGMKSWLASSKTWTDLGLGAPPNQAFFWSKEGSLQTYAATPLTGAPQRLSALTDRLLNDGNSWLASHGLGTFQRSPSSVGAIWKQVPSLEPFIEAVNGPNGTWVVGGVQPIAGLAASAPPAKLPFDVLQQTNLVLFDWESTGSRIESGVYVGQILRVALRRAQLPLQSVTWLRELAPRLAVCRTVVSRTGLNQLSFERKATLGLSAVELQLLADWFASPRFPEGLHTLLAPPDAPPVAKP